MKSYTKIIFLVVIFASFINTNHANDDIKIKCIKCDTGKNPDCLEKPKQYENKANCNKGDKCTTLITKESIVHRDCKSELASISPDMITECDGENCNNEEYFPKDKRRKCITCDENDQKCLDASALDDIKYGKYCIKSYKDNCFTFVSDNGTQAVRGCISDQKEGECKNYCVTCNENWCNKNDIKEKLNCYECNSVNETCKRPADKLGNENDCKIGVEPKECTTILLGREKPKDVCYTKQNGNNVERGCYKRVKPLIESNSTLVITGAEENNKCFPDISKCYQCSDKDKCQKNDTESLKSFSKECDKFTTACYRYDNKLDGTTTRGCGTPTNNTFIPYTSYCYSGNECLPPSPTKECYQCDSSNDENCATLKSGLTNKKECKDDVCVIRINENGHTIRGCKKDIASSNKICDVNDKLCYTCDSNLCNDLIFPKDRFKCYQCDNCDELKDQHPLPCPIYKKTDVCLITYVNGDNLNVLRGCLSNANLNKTCTDLKEKCYKCTTQKCNKWDKMKIQQSKCIQCDYFDEDCEWGFKADQGEICKTKIEFWKPDQCYTLKDNGKVTRGCVDKTLSGDKYEICENPLGSNNCNRENANNFTCIRCRSDNIGQESCGIAAQGIVPSKCGEPVTKEEKGCFTNKDENSGVVIRGCLVDLSDRDQEKCKNPDYELCKLCSEKDCNNDQINGASLIQLHKILSSFVILTILANVFNK